MRMVRSVLAAVSLATLVLAGCAASDEAAGEASGEALPGTITTLDEDPAGKRPTATTAGDPQPGPEEAVATAVAYLRREVGMTDPVAGAFRKTGEDTGEVPVHPRLGEGDRPAAGPITTVSLRRSDDAWWVTGTRAATILVDSPARLARISSPVTVTGRASAFEGNVQVRVIQERDGKDLLLRSGFVTGRGDGQLGPCRGQIPFRQPTRDTGSIFFFQPSAVDGQGALQATVVRVRFTPAG